MREIQRISITDSVVSSLRELIESGQYPVGERFPTEANLCDTLKVSRTSVREAMRVLQTLGYLELQPGRGAFVASLTPTIHTKNWYDVDGIKFHDFMEVRLSIEMLSVRLSVERASDKQIKELTQVHEAFCRAIESKDIVQMIMLDELFHSKIIAFTQNQLLININKQLLENFRRYRSNSFTDPKVYKNAVDPHSRILDCFLTRDSERSVQEMRRHLEITEEDMNTILKNA